MPFAATNDGIVNIGRNLSPPGNAIEQHGFLAKLSYGKNGVIIGGERKLGSCLEASYVVVLSEATVPGINFSCWWARPLNDEMRRGAGIKYGLCRICLTIHARKLKHIKVNGAASAKGALLPRMCRNRHEMPGNAAC